MPTLHPANRHSARPPCVTMVTGSSRGWKGQSSSSESARSTTTPGWRHWPGEIMVGESWLFLCVCVCVCVRVCQVRCVAFVCASFFFPWIKWKWEHQTYVVDVGNVVFVDSNRLLRENKFRISVPHTVARSSICIQTTRIHTVFYNYVQGRRQSPSKWYANPSVGSRCIQILLNKNTRWCCVKKKKVCLRCVAEISTLAH